MSLKEKRMRTPDFIQIHNHTQYSKFFAGLLVFPVNMLLEVCDMIKCKICGKNYKQITTSGHLRRHSITRDQYLEQFPGAKTVSEETVNAHSKAMKKKVKDGSHFVPFRDIPGLARKTHDKHMEGPVEFVCIRCGKVKKTNRYIAERRKYCSNKCHSSHVAEHPELHQERNRNISKAKKGKPLKGGYSRCKGGYREDIGHYVRSGWEADVCRIFQHCDAEYDYEAFSVQLNNNNDPMTWIIDFVDHDRILSDNGLIEVKGWWDSKSKLKAKLLKKQRPTVYNKITFIGREEMRELIRKYSSIIPNWESKR